jgi:hypothetical protein
MKSIGTFISLILIFTNCTTNSDSKEKTNPSVETVEQNVIDNKNDSIIEHHLRVLDSVSNSHSKDTEYYCCTPILIYLEKISGIGASTEGTALGRLSYTKQDLKNWHSWYEKHKK